jgi:hypothetical protein
MIGEKLTKGEEIEVEVKMTGEQKANEPRTGDQGGSRHDRRWPVIGQSGVTDVCREIGESIVELERAFEAGILRVNPSRSK